MLKTGMLYSGDDLIFHLNRIEEIYQCLVHGSYIPNISIYTFNQVGDGVNFFYPWISIYPFALLRFIYNNPVNSIYIGLWLQTLLTLIIAHYSMYKFSTSKIQSIIFSLVYTLSMYRACAVYTRFDLGESIAITVLPIVFLGIYYSFYGDYKKWIYLTAGLVGLLYSHILSLAIIIMFMLLLFVFTWKEIKERKMRLKKILLSFFLTAALTTIVWMPFLEQYFNTDIHKPIILNLSSSAQKVSDTINASFSNNFGSNIGIFMAVTLIIGWYFFRKSTRYMSIYLIGLVLFILSSNLFPWKTLQNTPLNIIQFPWRLMILIDIVLSVAYSKVCLMILEKYKEKTKKVLMTLLLIFLPILFYYASAQSYVESVQYQELLDYKPTANHPIAFNPLQRYKVNAENYRYQFYYFENDFGARDYFPSASINDSHGILIHKLFINEKDSGVAIYPKVKNNTINFYVDHVKTHDSIDLPFLAYKNYMIKINSKTVNYKISQRGTLEVSAVSSRNHIMIKYDTSIIEKLSILITILAYLVMTVLFIIRFKTRLK